MQSNVEWRRKANTIDTAAQNAVNQQNAQNAFGLSTQAMTFMWQELRDQASYVFQGEQNEAQRQAGLFNTILGQAADIRDWGKLQEPYADMVDSVSSWFDVDPHTGSY